MRGFTVIAALLVTGYGWAQEVPATKAAEKPTTIKAEARLVSLPVVVRDKKGALVRTLNKPDFVLNVDGKTQPIRYFDKDDDLPLTLGLLVDTSMSQRNVLDEERTASEGFLDGMLGTRTVEATKVGAGDKAAEKPVPDRAFVIQFAHEVELLQDLTDSKPKLKAALKELDSPSYGGGGQGGSGQDAGQSGDQNDGSNRQDSGQGGRSGGRGGRGSRGAGTALYDAVYLSADEEMSKQHGRKALVILSDGDDRGSKKSLASSIESAQRADTIIYAIYFKGQGGGGGGGNRGGGFPGGGGRRGGGGGWPGGGGQGGGGQGGGGGRGGESSVDGKKVLARMADETGGKMFEVKGKETVTTIYAEIAEELRSQYRLGFTPDAADAAEGYHQVTVTVPSGKNLRVQTRDGYYTASK